VKRNHLRTIGDEQQGLSNPILDLFEDIYPPLRKQLVLYRHNNLSDRKLREGREFPPAPWIFYLHRVELELGLEMEWALVFPEAAPFCDPFSFLTEASFPGFPLELLSARLRD
jgi:hypothetical protein